MALHIHLTDMRRTLIILILLIPILTKAGTYYVSTTGNDSNAGTLAAPWATWQKGFSTIVAGDTLYIRGGTYQPVGTSIGTVFTTEWFGCVALDGHNGTSENRIVVMNYPDEIPILDGVNNTAANNGGPGSRFGIVMRRCDYWTLKGLNVTGVVQLEGELGVAGIRFQENADHNEIIECNVYSCGGSGISFLYDCTDNLIYNCDSYDNYDHLSVPTPGNNSDGIEIADITDTAMINTVRGCRMWDNSDDGMDLMRNEGIVIIDSCWAFYNGVTADYPATGFKLGQAYQDPVTYQREVTNCIAAYNNSVGFACNVSYQKMKVYNNIAYHNNSHGFWWYIGERGGASILRNNISFGNVAYQYSYIYLDTYTFDHNNWDAYFDQTGPVASTEDFVTMDTLGLRYSRKTGGYLPDINFAKLRSTSDLIDAGTDVGIAYTGILPDLGPFEYVAGEIDEDDFPRVEALGTGTGTDLMVDKNGNVMIIR